MRPEIEQLTDLSKTLGDMLDELNYYDFNENIILILRLIRRIYKILDELDNATLTEMELEILKKIKCYEIYKISGIYPPHIDGYDLKFVEKKISIYKDNETVIKNKERKFNHETKRNNNKRI